MSYKIIRFYRDENKRQRTIDSGLTLKQAQYHCSLETTHKKDESGNVLWFDGYTEE
ncbi:MAG: hypothetical protein NT038_07960 [Euryarchaeota archaeon]|nr:hypothetical protein [Euryarchaeota archaeon]